MKYLIITLLALCFCSESPTSVKNDVVVRIEWYETSKSSDLYVYEDNDLHFIMLQNVMVDTTYCRNGAALHAEYRTSVLCKRDAVVTRGLVWRIE